MTARLIRVSKFDLGKNEPVCVRTDIARTATTQMKQHNAALHLAEDRAALWARGGAAEFLTDAEKREMVGVGV
jgi:phage portal protein BeeE